MKKLLDNNTPYVHYNYLRLLIGTSPDPSVLQDIIWLNVSVNCAARSMHSTLLHIVCSFVLFVIDAYRRSIHIVLLQFVYKVPLLYLVEERMVRPNILECVCMSSVVLLICKLSLILFSAGLWVYSIYLLRLSPVLLFQLLYKLISGFF